MSNLRQPWLPVENFTNIYIMYGELLILFGKEIYTLSSLGYRFIYLYFNEYTYFISLLQTSKSSRIQTHLHSFRCQRTKLTHCFFPLHPLEIGEVIFPPCVDCLCSFYYLATATKDWPPGCFDFDTCSTITLHLLTDLGLTS